jgi:hypothetical protein
MVSAVRLRRRLRLQTKRILVRSLTLSKISSLVNQTDFGNNLPNAGQMNRIRSRSDERKLASYAVAGVGG